MRKFGIAVVILLLIAALALMVTSTGILSVPFVGSWGPNVSSTINMPFTTSLESETDHVAEIRAKLTTHTPHGQISVTGADVAEVQIHMHVQTRAATPLRVQEIMGEVSLEMSSNHDENTVQVNVPKLRNNETARADLTILVPMQTQLDLKTGLGQVEVVNIEGSVRVLDQLGTITLKDIKGDAYLETALGNIEITDSTFADELVALSHLGDLTIEASLANRNVLESSLGDVTLLLSPEESYVLEGELSLGSFNLSVPFKGQQGKGSIRGIVGEGEQRGSIVVDLSLGSLAIRLK